MNWRIKDKAEFELAAPNKCGFLCVMLALLWFSTFELLFPPTSSAGPNANAQWTATLDRTSGVQPGEVVNLMISATNLNGATGYTAAVWYNTAQFDTPTAKNDLPGAVELTVTTVANTDVEGFDTQSRFGAAMLGTPAVDGDGAITTFSFTTKGGFTTGSLGALWIALRAGSEVDTVYINSNQSPLILPVNQEPITEEPILEPLLGDIDRDGDVDLDDFFTLANNFGKTGGDTTTQTVT